MMYYFWLFFVFAAACGPFLVEVSRGYCLGVVCGVSFRWLFLLQSMESRVHRLQQLWIAHSRAWAQ